MATVIDRRTFDWEGKPFRCMECGSVVAFTSADLGDLLYGVFGFRHTLRDGWTCRRKQCEVCHASLARHYEVKDGNLARDETR